MTTHTCHRCGAELKTVTVKRPIRGNVIPAGHQLILPLGDKYAEPMGYETVEEVADCVRCTGAY